IHTGREVRRASSTPASPTSTVKPFEDGAGGVEGVVELGGAVGEGDEAGLELRRGEVDAALQHAAEPAAEAGRGRPLRLAVAPHFAIAEEAGEHGADARLLQCNTSVPGGGGEAVGERARGPFELPAGARPPAA